jgi:hypothetical protein
MKNITKTMLFLVSNKAGRRRGGDQRRDPAEREVGDRYVVSTNTH